MTVGKMKAKVTWMRFVKNQDGMILVIVMLLMMVVAILGTIAINSSTVDVQITGNLKKSTESLAVAEAGVELSVPIIERTLAAGGLDPASFQVSGSNGTPKTVCLDKVGGDCSSETVNELAEEISGGKDYDPDTPGTAADFAVTRDGTTATVDIDRLYAYTLPGGAMEFASGYEGVGAAAAGGGIGVLYRITSEGAR